MSDRPLTPEEAALWSRVLETVKPLRVAPRPPAKLPAVKIAPARAAKPAPRAVVAPRKEVAASAARTMFETLLAIGVGGKDSARKKETGRPISTPPPLRKEPANTLDGSWDRKLSRGLVSPDCAIDLHGHTLATAYATLDGALEQAIRMGDRVVLLVTGKPPRPESERPHARGAIRAAIGDWLAGSRHASAIAAVRNAHPRHGGAGALYIILKRQC